MKIGLVFPGFSAHENDWCIPALTTLVQRLSARHQVRVLALRYPARRGSYHLHGAEIITLGGGQARRWAKGPLLGGALWTLGRLHRELPFDVLHGFWADEPGWVVARAGRMVSVPSVVTLLGGELVALPDIGYGGQLSIINRSLSHGALTTADRVTVGSGSLKDLVQSHGRTPVWLPIGVDTRRFSPRNREGAHDPLAVAECSPRGVRLLHVASLVPVKGQSVLLRAFARVAAARDDVSLHIVGQGPLRNPLEAEAAALGISARVRFHGAVEHDALPAYYRSADACVMSSRHEGQEWVTQEAAACGTTSIGTDVGVIRDLQPDTVAVSSSSDAALADAILRLVSNPGALRRAGRAAARAVRERYSIDGTVAALSRLYEILASSRLKRCTRSTSLSKSRSSTTVPTNPRFSSWPKKSASPSLERQSNT